jgi:ATP-dependent Clp protease ATP-binding subunit ClpB
VINPDRLTVKSTEALNDALGHARKNGNPLVYDLHLLHALLSQEESIVVPILQKLGVKSASSARAWSATWPGTRSSPGPRPACRAS